MTTDHPITPPPELFKQWENDILNERENVDVVLDCAWKNGYRAGADQELEACCAWVEREIGHGREWGAELRRLRRPKPLSLAEQALDALETEDDALPLMSLERSDRFDLIRRALERLQELEGAQ